MHTAGLQGRHPRAWKRTTVPGDHAAPAPDLIGRDFTAATADTRWCGDITYIKCWDGWAYMATVIDLHSRTLVGWAIDRHMRTSLVTDALDHGHPRTPTKRTGACSIPTAVLNIPREYSTDTADETIYAVPWARPESVMTTPYRNHSSRHTRRNSFIPGRGPTFNDSATRAMTGSPTTTIPREDIQH